MTLPDGPWLNVGSGLIVARAWTSVDGSWQVRLADHAWLSRLVTRLTGHEVGRWPRGIRYRDIRRGLGLESESVAIVYASHVLEHLYRDEAMVFLRDVHRTLKPGGVCRVVVPDVLAIVGWYLEHRQEANGAAEASSDVLMDLLSVHARRPPDGGVLGWVRRLTDLHTHKWMYDAIGLTRLMADAGFGGARAAGFLESAIPSDALRQVEQANRIVNGAGVVVEARKG